MMNVGDASTIQPDAVNLSAVPSNQTTSVTTTTTGPATATRKPSLWFLGVAVVIIVAIVTLKAMDQIVPNELFSALFVCLAAAAGVSSPNV